jgi:hypothetical protein
MNAGWKFDSVRLSRVDSKWRCVGKVHEYLAPPPLQSGISPIRVPRTEIVFQGN